MNDSSTPNASSGLVDRAKAIILNPTETWPVIAAEPSSPGEIITRYAIPLAAIGPIALFIGGQLFGISMVLATYHPSLMSGLSMALTSFVMSIVSLIVVALVADFLAPNFEGTANRTQAFKLVAYAMTPGWVAGLLGIMPSLMMLSVLAGLYGLYLFYLGAGPVMKVPQAKTAVYTVITAICAVVLMAIAGSITQRVGNMFGGGAAGMMSGSAGDNVEVNIPGVGTINTADIEKSAKDLENAKDVKPVELSALQALLPPSLGGYTRTAVESSGAGAMGAQAEGTYTSGDKTIRLKVVDMAAMGAVAGVMGGLGIEQNREDANGYERTTTKDGKLTIEKWDRSSNSGSYATQIGGRFLVEAEGDAGSIDELKSAVASIDASKLEALAK